MHQISHFDRHERGRLSYADSAPGAAPSLIAVLWRQRGMLVGCAAACLLIAGLYLLFATRVFLASAKVLVEQDDPAALNEGLGHVPLSEGYVQTQADVFQSRQVLLRALDAVNYRSLKTFAKAGLDPVNWVRRSGALKVDVAKKSDVIVISMESPYASEAADFANAVVREYIGEQAKRKRSVGMELVASLEKEKQGLKQKRDASIAAMEKFKREN